MKNRLGILLAGVLVFGLTVPGWAAESDTITVNFAVAAINELNIDDASVTLTVNTATAGSEPDQATDSSTYDITTNETGKKITAGLDSAMPAGATLYLNCTAPTGGTSEGDVDISSAITGTSDADVVTGIDQVAEADITMTFKLSATVSSGVIASDSRTCTLTLTDT
jgi:hypothetical protein